MRLFLRVGLVNLITWLEKGVAFAYANQGKALLQRL